VEGPTLAERIAEEGVLPEEAALAIAGQIADALESAHEKGIVHRDLKPGNIKITPAGVVKVLDFGLAKTGGIPSVQSENSPTVSMNETQAGVILGTAAYMSPEQAMGKPVDKRADIWSFGVVLYEMLTGQRLFRGETLQETLAGVLKEKPRWDRVPEKTRLLLKRCLEKDPKRRLRDIADAMPLVEQAPETRTVSPRHSWMWRVTAVVFVAAFTALAAVHFREQAPPPADPMRFQIVPPATPTDNGSMVLSPDGRRLAFSAIGSDRVTRIWVRSLDSLDSRPLPAEITSNVPTPFFWSPDSRSLVFQPAFGERLSRIDVSGGPAQVLCDGPSGYMLSGGWSRDGVIIFGSQTGPVMRVSATGGTATPVTGLDAALGDTSHSYPVLLPDGRHFLYLRRSSKAEQTGLYAGSLDVKPEDQSRKRILATTFAVNYVPPRGGGPGRLLFLREGVLMAQPFDLERLELVPSEPTVVVDQIGTWYSFGFFSASSNGVLAYRTGGVPNRKLTWFDHEGNVLGETPPQNDAAGVALSPDESQAAVVRGPDIYLTNFARGTSQPFTFGPRAADPVWSRDGNRIVFASSRNGRMDLYQKPANGSQAEQLLLHSEEDKVPMSWSRDGRFLLYGVNSNKTKGDLWILPMQGDSKTWPFLNSEANETDGQFSPDGNYIVYSSIDAGLSTVYVRQFSPNSAGGSSGSEGRWVVAKRGDRARWRPDGKELFYRSPVDDRLMSVEVTTSGSFQVGLPKPLFLPGVTGNAWDVSKDGKRFLFVTQVVQSAPSFTVVLNWDAALKK
jgi:eukaryotic-like serine/threonine-protein kinase